jgi:hypothetical protein
MSSTKSDARVDQAVTTQARSPNRTFDPLHVLALTVAIALAGIATYFSVTVMAASSQSRSLP